MFLQFVRVNVAFAVLVLCEASVGAQQQESPEPLPIPKSHFEPTIIIEPMEYFEPRLRPQMGTRDVWQLFGVTGNGQFRPRVIFAPAGAYYLYNGEPYPWTTTRPHWYRGFIAR